VEEEEKTYLDGSAMSVAGSTMASELARRLGWGSPAPGREI
jgi:hypothetical protein